MEEARLFGTALPSSGSADSQGVPEEQSGPLLAAQRPTPYALATKCMQWCSGAVLQCCSAAVLQWHLGYEVHEDGQRLGHLVGVVEGAGGPPVSRGVVPAPPGGWEGGEGKGGRLVGC